MCLYLSRERGSLGQENILFSFSYFLLLPTPMPPPLPLALHQYNCQLDTEWIGAFTHELFSQLVAEVSRNVHSTYPIWYVFSITSYVISTISLWVMRVPLNMFRKLKSGSVGTLPRSHRKLSAEFMVSSVSLLSLPQHHEALVHLVDLQ